MAVASTMISGREAAFRLIALQFLPAHRSVHRVFSRISSQPSAWMCQKLLVRNLARDKLTPQSTVVRSGHVSFKAQSGEALHSKYYFLLPPRSSFSIQQKGSQSILSITAGQVIHGTHALFVDFNIPEPVESTIHLLSDAFQLPWRTGYRTIHEILLQRDIDNHAVRATRIVGDVCQEECALSSHSSVTSDEISKIRSHLYRRLHHEPIQYIVGKWDFFGDYVYKIVPPLLCPRPETEELVELVLRRFPSASFGTPLSTKPLRILDVGCGTGCIGITLAACRPDWVVTAIDSDPVAVSVASENARLILLEEQIETSDSALLIYTGPLQASQPPDQVYEDQPHCSVKEDRYQAFLRSAQDFEVADARFDVIVSNPPYIPTINEDSLPRSVLEYESRSALFAGRDGLDVIRIIVQQLPFWGNVGATCFLEVDPSHPPQLREWLRTDGNEQMNQSCSPIGYVDYVATHQDTSGKDRFVQLEVRKVKQAI
jgi:release factor glutamine methyltransferase